MNPAATFPEGKEKKVENCGTNPQSKDSWKDFSRKTRHVKRKSFVASRDVIVRKKLNIMEDWDVSIWELNGCRVTLGFTPGSEVTTASKLAGRDACWLGLIWCAQRNRAGTLRSTRVDMTGRVGRRLYPSSQKLFQILQFSAKSVKRYILRNKGCGANFSFLGQTLDAWLKSWDFYVPVWKRMHGTWSELHRADWHFLHCLRKSEKKTPDNRRCLLETGTFTSTWTQQDVHIWKRKSKKILSWVFLKPSNVSMEFLLAEQFLSDFNCAYLLTRDPAAAEWANIECLWWERRGNQNGRGLASSAGYGVRGVGRENKLC